MKKSVLAVILVIAMVVVLFAGCTKPTPVNTESPGASGQPAGAASTPAATASQTPAPETEQEPEENPATVTYPLVDEPITYTIFATFDTAAYTITNYSDNMYYQELAKLTNIYLKFIHPAGNATEQFNLMMASQEYEDIIRYFSRYYTAGIEDAINQDIARPLNDWMQYMPNLMGKLEGQSELRRQMVTDNGYYWMIPNFMTEEQGAWGGPIVRKDLLDQLGLEIPRTYEEMENMLIAFRDKIPGMEAGPMSLWSTGFSFLHSYSAGYGLTGQMGLLNKDGTVYLSTLEPAFKDYLQMMARWYANSLIDHDFVTKNVILTDETGFLNGHIGLTEAAYDVGIRSYFGPDQEGWEIAPVPHPTINRGDHLHIRNCQDIIQTGNSEVITTNVTDDKMIPLLRYYDYMFSDEGTLLTNWGIEGVTFTYDENGKPQYTDLIVNNPDGMPFLGATSAFLGGRNAAGPYEWTRELDDYAIECMVAWNYPDRDWVYPTTTMTAEEGQRYTVIMGDIQTYVSESVLAFITGTKSFDEYDAFIEKVKSMGVEEAIQIKQAALDRYYNRIG